MQKIFFLLILIQTVKGNKCSSNVEFIGENDKKEIKDETNNFKIFQVDPLKFNLKYSWHTRQIEFYSKDIQSLNILFGDNSSHIEKLCHQSTLSNMGFINFIMNRIKRLFTDENNSKTFIINPFQQLTIGVETTGKNIYSVKSTIDFSYFKISATLLAVVLFFLSPMLAESMVFHFSIGILFSLIGSMLVLSFILSRFVPFRKTFYTISVLGSSILASILINMKDKLFMYFTLYSIYIIIYVISVSCLTFIVMYYYYPSEVSFKTLNIINAFLKFISSMFIVSCTNSYYVSIAIILFLFFYSNCPDNLNFANIKNRWYYHYFPIKRKYIPQEDYPKILKENTQKELDKLKAYLKSPQANTWKIIRNCSNPERLASFVDENLHLSHEEINLHDTFISDSDSSVDFDN